MDEDTSATKHDKTQHGNNKNVDKCFLMWYNVKEKRENNERI